MDVVTASREDLFGTSTQRVDDDEGSYNDIPDFKFETVDVEPSPAVAQEKSPSPEIPTFQLFAGMDLRPVNIENDDREHPINQEKSIEYYIYNSTPESKSRAQQVAVSGDYLLFQAQKYLKEARPVGEDINAHWRPSKKPCRPGSSVRRARRLKRRRSGPPPKRRNW